MLTVKFNSAVLKLIREQNTFRLALGRQKRKVTGNLPVIQKLLVSLSHGQPPATFLGRDRLALDDNDAENLKRIEAFRPLDGKIKLNLEQKFDENCLLHVEKPLSLAFSKWKLRLLW